MDTLSEGVEKELDRMIERRARKGEMDADEREEPWQQSVRIYNARRNDGMRAAWREYHRGQAARHRTVLEGLISHHETEAERYADRPKGEA